MIEFGCLQQPAAAQILFYDERASIGVRVQLI